MENDRFFSVCPELVDVVSRLSRMFLVMLLLADDDDDEIGDQ